MKPVGSKVIFKRSPDNQVSKGGIHLPNQGVKRYSRGEVIAAPDNWVEGGTVRSTDLSKGDTIVFLSSKSDQLDESLWWIDIVNIIYIEGKDY